MSLIRRELPRSTNARSGRTLSARGGTRILLPLSRSSAAVAAIPAAAALRGDGRWPHGGGRGRAHRRGVHLLGAVKWIHVSNNGLAGRHRNPDIEAVGAQVGLLIGF